MKRLFLIATIIICVAIVNINCSPEKTTSPEETAVIEETKLPKETAKTSPAEEISSPVNEETHIYTFTEVVALLEPSVVKVETPEGSGSGIIISSSGYILTNNHVIEGSSLVKITLMSGETYDGIVIAKDAIKDLAIIGIVTNRYDFPACQLDSSENIVIGEDVVAIGYALGLEGQVTFSKGIVSAIRMIDDKRYVQTDASINPGNSGGPLINLRGKVIGINSAKYAGIAIEGIGLAIPIDEAIPLINSTIGK